MITRTLFEFLDDFPAVLLGNGLELATLVLDSLARGAHPQIERRSSCPPPRQHGRSPSGCVLKPYTEAERVSTENNHLPYGLDGTSKHPRFVGISQEDF
jgi:hypothetical protein